MADGLHNLLICCGPMPAGGTPGCCDRCPACATPRHLCGHRTAAALRAAAGTPTHHTTEED